MLPFDFVDLDGEAGHQIDDHWIKLKRHAHESIDGLGVLPASNVARRCLTGRYETTGRSGGGLPQLLSDVVCSVVSHAKR